MNSSALSETVGTARDVFATDVEINITGMVLGVKYRVDGMMLLPTSVIDARAMVDALRYEVADGDLSETHAIRFRAWCDGLLAEFEFGLPRLFAKGQLTGDLNNCKVVLRLFSGAHEYSGFTQRVAATVD